MTVTRTCSHDVSVVLYILVQMKLVFYIDRDDMDEACGFNCRYFCGALVILYNENKAAIGPNREDKDNQVQVWRWCMLTFVRSDFILLCTPTSVPSGAGGFSASGGLHGGC